MSIKYKISVLILIIFLVFTSGCSNSSQYFKSEDISFIYPSTWKETPIPSVDQNLSNSSGFKMLGVILDGNNITDYVYYVGVARSDNNLESSNNNLYNNFILKEASSTPIMTQTNLRNGYPAYVYSYNGMGASSNRTIVEKTFVFTKDNITSYYIMFAAPQGHFQENKVNKIMDSVLIS